jgi:arginyl-tRNA synthetase
MIKFKAELKENIHKRIGEKYSIDRSELDINTTPSIKMGDLALAFAFQLAKKLKRNPRELAQEILPLISALEGVENAEVAGAGFINLYLKKPDFFLSRLQQVGQSSLDAEEKKIIIEHTNINPNKAAHIGHLRNACLGDTLGRCLIHKGEKVEIQNYIDDTGVQVVDVVFGFMDLEKKNLEDLEKHKGKFDYYCWDLYARVSAYFEEPPEAQTRRSEILKKIEERAIPEIQMADHISRRIIKAHLDTMKRLDITYDLLPCESSILALKFWDRAFFLLKEKRAIEFMNKGVNKGCWVMRLEEEEEREKVIVRSDQTVTYWSSG